MPRLVDRARLVLPSGLTSLAALACAACCMIPLLAGRRRALRRRLGRQRGVDVGIAVTLTGFAGAVWWWGPAPAACVTRPGVASFVILVHRQGRRHDRNRLHGRWLWSGSFRPDRSCGSWPCGRR